MRRWWSWRRTGRCWSRCGARARRSFRWLCSARTRRRSPTAWSTSVRFPRPPRAPQAQVSRPRSLLVLFVLLHIHLLQYYYSLQSTRFCLLLVLLVYEESSVRNYALCTSVHSVCLCLQRAVTSFIATWLRATCCSLQRTTWRSATSDWRARSRSTRASTLWTTPRKCLSPGTRTPHLLTQDYTVYSSIRVRK